MLIILGLVGYVLAFFLFELWRENKQTKKRNQRRSLLSPIENIKEDIIKEEFKLQGARNEIKNFSEDSILSSGLNRYTPMGMASVFYSHETLENAKKQEAAALFEIDRLKKDLQNLSDI